MEQLSDGQVLGLHQLKDIVDRSAGALEIVGTPLVAKDGAFLRLYLSLETRPYRHAGGLPLRDREPLILTIHEDFPFRKPSLHFGHKRFMGQPHIQWGSYVCLYQADAEYVPADGMFGFLERVRAWMIAAGRGELDPENAPLHPPVAYATSRQRFVIRANAPSITPGNAVWLGRADLVRVRDGRFDLMSWSPIDDWPPGLPEAPVAGVVLLSQPLATEYPTKVLGLFKLAEQAGAEPRLIYGILRLTALQTPAGEPGFLVLGAPMRRRAGGEPLRQHLTVWQIGADLMQALRNLVRSAGADEDAQKLVYDWLGEADVEWCSTLEDREEILVRRDDRSLLSTLARKRVLLLGCGALGSAVAESIVRAHAATIRLVDCASVKPGVLVRQRYADADIGRAKADALKERLKATGLPCVVTSEYADLGHAALTRFGLGEFDIVIDATASTTVTHRIERELANLSLPIPLLTMTVSASANDGCVMVRMPNFEGGPHGLVRQAKLEAHARHGRHPLVKAFWPEPGAQRVFQPEPGCSEPTFVGSAADIDFHAAALLNLGLKQMATLRAEEASMDLITAPWVDRGAQKETHLCFVFPGHAAQKEQRHGYSVRLAANAAKGMEAAIRRITREKSKLFETGGLIFGEIDDSHRYIWIDSVSGPPPDSESNPEKFLCGVGGTRELAAQRESSSGGSSRFVGIWHTHPVSIGQPSEDDLKAMVALLHGQAHPPRQVVMLIVGTSATAPVNNYYLFRRDEFHLIPINELNQDTGE